MTKKKHNSFTKAFLKRIEITVAKRFEDCNRHDLYLALAYAVRDVQVFKWVKTREKQQKSGAKKVYYLSLEFLMGRTLGNSLIYNGLYDEADASLQELGLELTDLLEAENDAGLGNGGLGRLAACFLDSMATLDLPAVGSGIRYDYGIFTQIIENGYQLEEPDNWLRTGNPWEVCRPERKRTISFYGKTITYRDHNGQTWHSWVDTEDVLALPYDTPIPGFGTETVNTLRLWSAKSLTGFNLQEFNKGDYISANLPLSLSENISKVLYPNDNNYEGKELRLKQQYFLTAATLHDIMDDLKAEKVDLRKMHEKIAIQLNDTHPAIAIPELMRLLIDEEGLQWEEAWNNCTKVFAYTNHTLLSEALEKWPVSLIQSLLPRHMEIIYEINHHFLRLVANHYPGHNEKLSELSIIEEGHEKHVRMAYLAIVGSHSVNGVAALHTDLLKHGLVKGFYDFSPEKFNNKTNGITPRRWLRKANPLLSHLITSKIGDKWVTDLNELKKLEKFTLNRDFCKNWQEIKTENKERLIEYINRKFTIKLSVNSIFDIQIKRMHEYKRQLMNVLHCIALYNDIKDNPSAAFTPRTIIFAGKAAPGYWMAKHIIKLINSVSTVVNNDPDVGDKLKLLFLPNYSVSMAEVLIPAADLSEQISTAGKEASGTGNMKFSLNGALTVGTLDGANVEIKDCVGDENIYIFGLNVTEVEELKQSGYNPHSYLQEGSRLKRVLNLIESGFFCPEEQELFKPITDSITCNGDEYMIAADFDSYYEAQQEISKDFLKKQLWTEKAIINVANMGMFSSDRTIRQYADEIWGVKSLK
ncbi:MAG: glycogen/starch/alpha-glucan phosphorylase [Lentisphaeraceae bacterium]|nr:glycogen/starch/alpha-glucan phosphorylase [Lentisphaeraceae bacterium]